MQCFLPKLINVIATFAVFMVKKARGKVLSSKLGLFMVRLTVWVAPPPLMVFEVPQNEIKCVLSNKESNFKARLGQHFHICLGTDGATKLDKFLHKF